MCKEKASNGMTPTTTRLGHFPVVDEPPQYVHDGIGVPGPTQGNGG